MAENNLSAAEAELYDRQIRLWGIESQQKLRNADVLLINVRSLGSETVKNILLSGVNSVTILDDGLVTEDDLLHNFLLSSNSKAGNKLAEEVLIKAQALNPLVKLTADTEKLSDKPPKFFEQFTIVVATSIEFGSLIKLDKICRQSKIKLIYGDVFGFFGFSISDLQEHDFFEDRVQLKGKRSHKGELKSKRVAGKISYPSLDKVLALPETKQKLAELNKRPNILFILLLTLVEFRKRHNRIPNWDKKEIDIEEMKAISKEVQEIQNTSLALDDYYELVFNEVGPVCAILGGVIAQEVVKAVSGKEVTINNVFLFDPIKYNGKEFCVGAA